MCSSTNIVSALGMFLRSRSRLVGLPIATCCVFIAALLLGIVVPSGAQTLCNEPYGDDYQEYGYNFCTASDTSCASSGPGYTCTVNGQPAGTQEWYSFSANTYNWYICLGGGYETYCSYQTYMQNCGTVRYFYQSGCAEGDSCNDVWYFVNCQMASLTH